MATYYLKLTEEVGGGDVMKVWESFRILYGPCKMVLKGNVWVEDKGGFEPAFYNGLGVEVIAVGFQRLEVQERDGRGEKTRVYVPKYNPVKEKATGPNSTPEIMFISDVP